MGLGGDQAGLLLAVLHLRVQSMVCAAWSACGCVACAAFLPEHCEQRACALRSPHLQRDAPVVCLLQQSSQVLAAFTAHS